jgi:DNA-binding winged helix-turn-helix (wHTH) protein
MRFGVFEVDLQSRELRKRGIRLKVHDQTFQLLGALLERPGEIITREELRQKLWPGDTFVDFDHGINTAVKKLRGALGDSSDNPIFVETISRHGYRFLPPVDGVATEASAGMDAPAAEIELGDETVPLSRKRERLAWLTVLLLIGFIAIYAVLYLRPAPESRVVQFEVTLGENPSSPPPSPSISPDGQYLAIQTKEGDGPFKIWLHSISSLTSGALAETEGGFAPFWSPDSRYIAFSTPWGLKRISIRGGTPETICNLPAAGRGSWSRDGVIVFTPEHNN